MDDRKFPIEIYFTVRRPSKSPDLWQDLSY